MLRLLLAGVPPVAAEVQQRSSRSNTIEEDTAPGQLQHFASNGFKAGAEAEAAAAAAAETAAAATGESVTSRAPLSRSGKRQRTAEPLCTEVKIHCKKNKGMKQKSSHALSEEEIDERLSAAIAKLVENSPELNEIFYYATTDPSAIEVPL